MTRESEVLWLSDGIHLPDPIPGARSRTVHRYLRSTREVTRYSPALSESHTWADPGAVEGNNLYSFLLLVSCSRRLHRRRPLGHSPLVWQRFYEYPFPLIAVWVLPKISSLS